MKVLIVDDQPDVLEMLKEFFARKFPQCQVLDSKNGKDALAVLDEHKDIKLIISDFIMPEVNGLVLANITKTIHPDVKIVIISAYMDVEVHILKERNIVEDIIGKPFGIKAFVSVVEPIINSIESQTNCFTRKNHMKM